MTSTSTFDKAFNYIITWEGGYSNIPSDKGLETKYGISKRQYPDEDIKNLTIERAKELYLADYWNKNQLDTVVDPRISIKLFDAIVNMGAFRAISKAQEALRQCGLDVGVDGHMGPHTAETLNKVDYFEWIKAFVLILERYYISLNQPVFLKGWLNRAHACPDL